MGRGATIVRGGAGGAQTLAVDRAAACGRLNKGVRAIEQDAATVTLTLMFAVDVAAKLQPGAAQAIRIVLAAVLPRIWPRIPSPDATMAPSWSDRIALQP